MEEVWKDVRGLGHIAEVSNLGRVRTKDRYVNNNGTEVLYKGRIKKGYDNGIGYIQYRFYENGKITRKYGHVLVMEAFTDKPSDKYEVDHIDNDKKNNKLDNLQWLTKSENISKMCEFYGRVKTDTYCKCGNIMDKKANKCKECSSIASRKVKDRPSKDMLLSLIKSMSFPEVGRMYNVSENTIRKWCKLYGLPYKAKDIISDTKRIRKKSTQVVKKGSEVSNAKLDENKVLEIDEKLKLGVSQRALAKEYNVSKGAIQRIKERKSWRHVLIAE